MPVRLQFSVTNGVGSVDDNNNSKDFALRVIGQPFKGTPWANILPIEMAGNFAIGEQPLDANGAQTRLFLQDNRLVVFEATTRGLRQRYGGDIWYNKDYKDNGALPIPVSAMFEFIYESQERDGPNLGWLPDVIRYGYVLQGGAMLMGSRSKNGLELVAKVGGIDMDDDANNGGAGDLVGQTLTTYGFGLNYWPIKEVRLTIDGFIFNFERPVGSPTSPDPFLNGDTAWVILMGAYFKF